jgi:SAM-dependent methyltransferase
MPKDALFEVRQALMAQGAGRFAYTRKAFRMLPALDRPRMLDVGCGFGGPTLELARLSGGQIVALDVERSALDVLVRSASEAGLSARVLPVQGSLSAVGFPDETFDVIWAEGSIWVIGFERGLTDWHRLIRPGGFLVVHEMVWLRPDPPPDVSQHWRSVYPDIRTVPETLVRIPACGYELVDHFALPADAWWTDYYAPMRERIPALRQAFADEPDALAALDREEQEARLYRKHMRWQGSAFFVLRKGSNTPPHA